MADILTRAGCFIAIILLGMVLRRVGFFKQEDFYVLSKIVVKITLTAAIVKSFVGRELEPSMIILTLIGFGFGVLFLGMAFCNGQPSVTGVMIPIWLMILCSTIMGVGTSVGGERIIKSVGQDMVKLEKYQGFSADLSSALCLLVMTVLGIPVSTTHTKTSAIMGVGAT
mgnify:CR=1 FL=1